MLGCAAPSATPAEEKTLENISNETLNETAVLPPPPPLSVVEEESEELPEAEEPAPVEEPPPPALEVQTKNYTDPREVFQLEYPEIWKVKSQIGAGSGGYTLILVPLNEQYLEESIRVTYTTSLITFEEEETRLEEAGQTLERKVINQRDFIIYEVNLEPLPGKRIRERTALTVKENRVFRITLSTRARHFEAFLPDYEKVLNSVKIS